MNSPSPSTIASVGIGVPFATILSWLLSTCCQIPMPGPVEAAVGALVSALVGYFFTGGRRADVE